MKCQEAAGWALGVPWHYRADTQVHVVMSEAALRHHFCPIDVMEGQLDRLLGAATMRTARIGAVPFDAARAGAARCWSARIETVEPGEGMPCTMCMLYRSHTRPPQQPSTSPSPHDQDVDNSQAMAGYRAWGWPVTCHEDRLLLTLGSEATALLIPLGFADRVQTVLVARTCRVRF